MPLFWLSLAFVAGIIFSASLPLDTTQWLWSAGGVLLFGLARRFLSKASRRRISTPPPIRQALQALRGLPGVTTLSPMVLIVVFCLGAARFQVALPTSDPGFIAWYNASDLETATARVVMGLVVKPPDVRDRYTNLTVQVEQFLPQDESSFKPVHGLLLARVPPGGAWRYGDWIRLEGVLQAPPAAEDFSYREYLARQGIHTYMPDARCRLLLRGQGNPVLASIYAIRDRAQAVIYTLYPDPEASLLVGILLGVERGIPEEVQQAFKATGTSHIIAISGFNMTIIGALFATLFGRVLGRRRGAVAAVIGIGTYTILVGANAAVMRAAIMGGMGLFAKEVGRRQDGLNTLAFVAAVMALFNPHVPWDVGFQLSFMATLGLVLYADPFAQAFVRAASRRMPEAVAQRLAEPVGEYILFTLAAQLTTLPVMAYHFGRISLISLVANPFILPAQPAVMIVGGLATIFGLIWLPLGKLVSFVAWPFVVYTIRIVEFFAKAPARELLLGELALLVVVLYYALLFSLTYLRQHFPSMIASLRPAGAVGTLGILCILAWRAALAAPDGRLHLTVLDVSTAAISGEAILIRTPTGRSLLIDGGPSPSRLSDGLGRRLPLANRQLDWLVAAGAGDGQLGALPRTLDRFRPGNVLWVGPLNSTYTARSLQVYLRGAQIPVSLAEAGHVLDLGQGARLQVLGVGKRGGLLLVEWGCFRALLPLGISAEELASVNDSRATGAVTALLLADSGNPKANPPAWLADLRPKLALVSAAPAARDSLLSEETLEALGGVTLLHTADVGWIHLTTDGERVWVEAERK